VQSAPARLDQCRAAILRRDFAAFAEVVELDSNVMHAIMMTGHPALFYWQAETLMVMELVRGLRLRGVPVCYTIDAGPNVHCLCAPGGAEAVREALSDIPGVLEVREALPGGGVRLIEES
jgi:diphosphomevalonate decarboxylase